MMQPQNKDGVTPELRAISSTDPAVELRKAIARNDLRFLGVAGVGLFVPGVPGGGTTNPVVGIRRVRIIEGTGESIAQHRRLQTVATRYAERYNRLLFAHLLRVNDPAVGQARHKIDLELARLEQRDPLRDAEKSVRSSPPFLLIELPGVEKLPGIDNKALKAAENADTLGGNIGYEAWSFIFVSEIMTPLQRKRLARQVTRYIAPYNRYVFECYRHKPMKLK